jgi:ribose-phosphate pyrophosphokinase
VVATHGLLVGPAIARLAPLPLRRIVVTDSLPLPQQDSLPLQVVSLAPTLAETITRLNVGESLSDLLSHR